MVKKRLTNVLVVFMALALVGATGFYFFEDIEFVAVMSGNVVGEKVTSFYGSSSFDSRLSVLLILLVVIIALVLDFFIIKKSTKRKGFSKSNFIKNKAGDPRTDLDTLYEVLKQKKVVEMTDVEKAFSISSDVALDWAKVLENGDLAIIDYPRFGKPVLRLIEEVSPEEKEGKEKEMKDDDKTGEVLVKGKVARKKVSHREGVANNNKRKVERKLKVIKKVKKKSKVVKKTKKRVTRGAKKVKKIKKKARKR